MVTNDQTNKQPGEPKGAFDMHIMWHTLTDGLVAKKLTERRGTDSGNKQGSHFLEFRKHIHLTYNLVLPTVKPEAAGGLRI